MSFAITPNRLNNEARRAVWAKGFPAGMPTGFDVYFCGANLDNICALCSDEAWWRANSIAYLPSHQVKNWIDENYPELEEDMARLAKFLFLTKDGAYHERADYVTRLWEERGDKLLQLLYLQYMPEFLSGIFPGVVSKDVLETISICWLSADFPANLPEHLSGLAELGIDNDLQGFAFWFGRQYGMAIALDSLLGMLSRSYAGDIDFDGESAPSDPALNGGGSAASIAEPEIG